MKSYIKCASGKKGIDLASLKEAIKYLFEVANSELPRGRKVGVTKIAIDKERSSTITYDVNIYYTAKNREGWVRGKNIPTNCIIPKYFLISDDIIDQIRYDAVMSDELESQLKDEAFEKFRNAVEQNKGNIIYDYVRYESEAAFSFTAKPIGYNGEKYNLTKQTQNSWDNNYTLSNKSGLSTNILLSSPHASERLKNYYYKSSHAFNYVIKLIKNNCDVLNLAEANFETVSEFNSYEHAIKKALENKYNVTIHFPNDWWEDDQFKFDIKSNDNGNLKYFKHRINWDTINIDKLMQIVENDVIILCEGEPKPLTDKSNMIYDEYEFDYFGDL